MQIVGALETTGDCQKYSQKCHRALDEFLDFFVNKPVSIVAEICEVRQL